MTFETAKRLVQEQGESASKEALAVVRGGMTICENTSDGSRKYVWVKVKPTLTDDVSSIDTALEHRRKKSSKQTSNTVKETPQTSTVLCSTPTVQELPNDSETQLERPSFFERLKNKAVEIWHEIDSIVIE